MYCLRWVTALLPEHADPEPIGPGKGVVRMVAVAILLAMAVLLLVVRTV